MESLSTKANEQVDKYLAGVDELPSLPQVAIRVSQLMREATTTAGDVETAISSDQALAGKVLRLANSAFYGLPRTVASLKDAVVLLGFRRISSLVLSVTTSELIGGFASDANMMRVRRWRHALMCASCARCLAAETRASDPDEAFTVGLLHDVGKLLFDDQAGDDYRAVSKECEDQSLAVSLAEEALFGFDHAVLGGALVERWGLPPSLSQPIRYHHAAFESPSAQEGQSHICHVADGMAHCLKIKVTPGGRVYAPPEDLQVPPLVDPSVLDALGLRAEDVKGLSEKAGQLASEQEAFFRSM